MQAAVRHADRQTGIGGHACMQAGSLKLVDKKLLKMLGIKNGSDKLTTDLTT